MPAKDHLSVSQIETHNHCGERHRLRYAEGLKEPASPDLIRGRVIHQSVARDMRAKRDAGALLETEAIRDLASDDIEAGFKEEIRLSEEESALGINAVKAEAKHISIRLSSTHHLLAAPKIAPASIEERIEIEHPATGKLVAILDLTDAEDRIRDTKTAKKAPDEGAADRSMQLTAYQLAFHAKNKRPPSALVLDNLIFRAPTKTLPERAEYLPLEAPPRSSAMLQAFIDRVEITRASIASGIAVPTDLSSWKCSPKYCGFFGDACRYTRGLKK